MSETPWIKFYPADFLNGVAELRPNEMAVYTIVLMRIYDEDAPIPYDPAKISRRCNMRRPACENALSALADAGKLIIENGLIDNKRARKERGKRFETRAKQSCNAHKRWNDGTEKGNKINGTAMPSQCQTDATHMPTRSQKPEARERETRGRAKPLPPDFNIPPEEEESLKALRPDVDVGLQIANWRDHRIAEGAERVDWLADLRKWIRNSVVKPGGKSNGKGVKAAWARSFAEWTETDISECLEAVEMLGEAEAKRKYKYTGEQIRKARQPREVA